MHTGGMRRIPPPQNELFKWRKGAKRLSDWMERGGLLPVDPGIINQQPPTLTAAPPLQTRREEARAAMWSRVAARATTRTRMSNAAEDGDDAHFTRDVVASVMAESRQDEADRGEGDDASSEDEMVQQLERELEQQQARVIDHAGRLQASPADDEPQRELDDDDVVAMLWAQLQRDAPELTRPDGPSAEGV